MGGVSVHIKATCIGSTPIELCSHAKNGTFLMARFVPFLAQIAFHMHNRPFLAQIALCLSIEPHVHNGPFMAQIALYTFCFVPFLAQIALHNVPVLAQAAL